MHLNSWKGEDAHAKCIHQPQKKAQKQMKLHMVPASLTISGYMTKQDVDKTKNFKRLFLHVSLFGGKDYKSY